MTTPRFLTRGMSIGDRVASRLQQDGRFVMGVVVRVSIDTPEVPRSRAVYVLWDTGHEELVLTSELRRLQQ